jgi:hypothetical protein
LGVRQEISYFHVNQNKNDLNNIRNNLVVEKMKIDKDISIFLSNQNIYDMNPENGKTELWDKYHQLCKSREEVSGNLNLCTFYLGTM